MYLGWVVGKKPGSDTHTYGIIAIFFAPQADTTVNSSVHGEAYIGMRESQLAPPIGWAMGGDYLTFAHELGHIFGCHHNREERGGGQPWDMLTN